MCIIHLLNNSIIHIFYRTQVLRIVQKFSKIFDKIFSLNNMLCTTLFYFLKSIPKISKNFSFEHFKTLTSRFSMFETCNYPSFLIPELLASALLFTFVENKLSLEPRLFKLLHFWFTYPPILVHNSLTTSRFNSST